MNLLADQPGFVAISRRGESSASGLTQSADGPPGLAVDTLRESGLTVVSWGLAGDLAAGEPLLLGTVSRRRNSDPGPADVTNSMRSADTRALREMLPPFAAVRRPKPGELEVVTDLMGFRQVYVAQGRGWVAVSSSALLLGQFTNHEKDPAGLAVQSLLGWQLAQRTLLAGVRKLEPGEWLRIADGDARSTYLDGFPAPRNDDIDGAVSTAASVLRTSVPALLDDHPDAVLQLTGGQDSRLLLSAIPRARRRGLRVMTLGRPEDPDVQIAADLCRRYGMLHEVHWFDGLESIRPEDAHTLCVRAATRLDGMSDPIALAALAWAEAQFDQSPRLSGLGGEVARGFYYLGPGREAPVTENRAARLAAWRMFANESAESAALSPDFVDHARAVADRAVFDALSVSGEPWLASTDDLYLRHRMQRWAGVTDTAVGFDRLVVNPMLDDRFLDLATGLVPAQKRRGRFLSRLQVELDEELASLPLDGRPPPRAYAHSSPSNSARTAYTVAGRFVRKARQRVSRTHRPPAGGVVLSAKVVEHWRTRPEELDAARRSSIVQESWLDKVVAGTIDPSPSTVAFLLNLQLIP